MKVTKNPFQGLKDVSFFLRIHRHLPDEICNGITDDNQFFPPSNCMYRENGKPINVGNDYVEELQKNPDFLKKEKEVEEAQKSGKPLFKGKKLTAKEGLKRALLEAKF